MLWDLFVELQKAVAFYCFLVLCISVHYCLIMFLCQIRLQFETGRSNDHVVHVKFFLMSSLSETSQIYSTNYSHVLNGSPDIPL